MQQETPIGPFCQSCSMPLTKPEDFGTGAEGYRQNDYCVHCYQHGEFTQPEMTMQQMIDSSVPHMAQGTEMSEAEARAILERYLPLCKRWREG